MENKTQQEEVFDTNEMADPVFKKITETTENDKQIAEVAVKKISELLKGLLDEVDDFTVKHAFLALSRSMGYLTQAFTNSPEEFEEEMDKANALAVEKMMPSIMPKMQDGKIIEEDFDMNDLSLKRILMALSCAVDYTFWRNELAHYSEIRKQEEANSKNQGDIA